MQKITYCSLVFFLFFSFSASAQDEKEKIEQERKELQKEIREIENQYSKLKGQTKQSLSQLNLIQRKLNLQNKYVSNISKELRYINDDIYMSNLEIYRLERQLDTLKAQYAKSIVYSYKNRGTYNFLNFIFSANGFNAALKRIAYLKSYRSYREQQVRNILETRKKIEQRKIEMLTKKEEKNEALENQSKQVKELQNTKKEQSNVVAKLREKEKDLKKELDAKKKRDRDLSNQIAAIVKREMDKIKNQNPGANPRITEGSANPSRPYINLNAADEALNADFEKNKGKLPWPVDNGFTKLKFGKYEYKLSEGSKPLVGVNPGITITTPKGSSVKAIFAGEVSSVSRVGDVVMVVIRHGKYFTAYSNLSSASVSRGAKVVKGQEIGKAAADDNDDREGMVDLIIMEVDKELNPELWLRK